jgi:hypothetical protein
MRHKDVQTTMRYVEMASRMQKAAETVYVPGFLAKAGGKAIGCLPSVVRVQST